MRYLYFKLLVIIFVFSGLSGCGKKEKTVEVPDIRPVKTFVIMDSQYLGARNFPGVIGAVQHAQISFRVAGKVYKINVKEGDLVEKGDVLAELDPTDFQVTLNNKKATFERTKADFTRGSELVKDGFISKTQYDKMKADFTSAKSLLNQAKNDLKYTKLKASFSGVIGKRYVQNHEEIQAKQEIFNLNDISQLEVKINVPENLVRMTNEETADFKVFATFPNSSDIQFPLSLKELAKTADPQTQTFEATFVMSQPDELSLLPGMTTSVVMQHGSTSVAEAVFLLPVSAVKGASDLSPTVFVVDPESSTIQARMVKVADMSGSEIKVIEGINIGDRVVTAGIAFLREGQKVTVLPDVEQADPATAP
ncbi:efflux RND transporter periplasmic adaptor subunit [Psychromonas ossibalaenae]|uniref:efflux RND transporter periplasmic adaptor subunit n=1 Tax=Psychromonas ossibalaenae TaxID=444922 RepID=UPI00036282ED|nr:efflux RND transporter periplasmic adaptor subunit [Psychromonas ossibalaenae]